MGWYELAKLAHIKFRFTDCNGLQADRSGRLGGEITPSWPKLLATDSFPEESIWVFVENRLSYQVSARKWGPPCSAQFTGTIRTVLQIRNTSTEISPDHPVRSKARRSFVFPNGRRDNPSGTPFHRYSIRADTVQRLPSIQMKVGLS
jgi:hypothetical protein